jgi:subtilisin family serine protease
MDPNYFDVERSAIDPYYSTPYPDPMSDPDVLDFIADENLTVVNVWRVTDSIGALLPPGQTVADAVANWPTQYAGVVDVVDPDDLTRADTFETGNPNDDRWNDQWHLQHSEQYSIDIQRVWWQGDQDSQDYRRAVTAVIDTGVDYDAWDGIQQQWVTNYDLVRNSTQYGCNVGDGQSATSFAFRTNEGGEPWEWLMNRNPLNAKVLGHGTSVAGVVAAHIDNDVDNPDVLEDAKDIAGVAYNPYYFPIAMKGHGRTSNGDEFVEYSSWAFFHAYDALGCSKGVYDENKVYGPGFFVPTYNIEAVCCSYSSILKRPAEAHHFAFLPNYMVFVCSAGNNNSDTIKKWPAEYTNVICVAGHKDDGTRGTMSNYQPAVDTAAPGEDIRTTDMIGHTPAGYDRGYTALRTFEADGTSMAAPQVAALASLIAGKYPALTPSSIRGTILTNERNDLIGPFSWIRRISCYDAMN